MESFHAFYPQRVVKTPCVLTFGTFDGIHLGHQHLFREVLKVARKSHFFSAIVTFTNHPLSIVRPEIAPQLITSPSEKHELLQKIGFDVALEIPFTKEFSQLTADQFIEKICMMFTVGAVVVGEDVVYGHNRSGNREHLEKMAKEHHFACHFLSKFTLENEVISSTKIRELLAQKDFATASKLLGRTIVDQV